MGKVINFLIYHYVPSIPWNATLLSLFGLSALVHSYQAYRSRYWIFYPTLVLGTVIEIMGYSARVWSGKQVYQLTPFLMQICLLIMAPVYFSAFLYSWLGVAIHKLGQQYSVLTPRLYMIVFITADLVSLILQAIGGGQSAAGAATSAPTQSATDITVAGIIFQLITMAIFVGCAVDFGVRVLRRKPWAFRLRQMAAGEKSLEAGSGTSTPLEVAAESGDLRKWKFIFAAMMLSSLMILLRGLFRSIELSQGWGGYLISREIYQAVLDGVPMVIAVGIFNFIHPGLILGRKESWKSYY